MEKIDNEKRKNIVNWLCSKIGSSVPINELLNKYLFTKTNLIINQEQQYAMYYLDLETFNDKEKKDEYIKQLLEVMTFLKFLNTKGFICIYQNSHFKNSEFYSLGKFIEEPTQSRRKLILNKEGAYSILPDCIQNADDEVIFKGIKFESEEYSLIKNHVMGNIFISKTIKDIFDCSDIDIENEEKEETLNEKDNQEENDIEHKDAIIEKEDKATTNTNENNEKKDNLDDLILDTNLKEKNDKVIKELLDSKPKIEDTPTLKQEEEKYIFEYYQLLKGVLLLLTFIGTFSILLYFYYNIKELKKSNIHITNKQIELINTIDDLKKIHYEDNLEKHYNIDLRKWNKKDSLLNIPRYVDFVLLDATVGIKQIRDSFKNAWDELDKLNITRAPYHTYLYAQDPEFQAKNFFISINDIKDTDISPLINLNETLLTSDEDFDKKVFQKELILFLSKLEKLTNRQPILYTTKRFANNYLNIIQLLEYKVLFKFYKDDTSTSNKDFTIYKSINYYDSMSRKEDLDIFYGDILKLKQ